MTVAIQGLRFGKAVGGDNIQAEVLTVLNRRGVCCLTRVCQVTQKLEKSSKDWQTCVIIHSYIQERHCQEYESSRNITSYPSRKSVQGTLKRNVKKL